MCVNWNGNLDSLIAADEKEIDVLEVSLEWIPDDRLWQCEFDLAIDIDIEEDVGGLDRLYYILGRK